MSYGASGSKVTTHIPHGEEVYIVTSSSILTIRSTRMDDAAAAFSALSSLSRGGNASVECDPVLAYLGLVFLSFLVLSVHSGSLFPDVVNISINGKRIHR